MSELVYTFMWFILLAATIMGIGVIIGLLWGYNMLKGKKK